MRINFKVGSVPPGDMDLYIYTQRLTRIKLTRISGDFLRHLVPGLIAKSYMPWMKMQYLTGGQRLYANSATAVDQICRFQGKIRIKVDKTA